jgi:hypothetical protein
MAEVTNELIYDVLKSIQELLGRMEEGQRSIREELTALRGTSSPCSATSIISMSVSMPSRKS